ncbi:MAG: tetrahydromethanopterin S-methyltransferase subunit F [Methanobrevibacter sp.]|jgi:tetrahydromethanopterin S-methyltransferase subunit F|uniref:Tetrahydromethanopterin S-methyltransferase subunit F n=1 Tax=Methanobrevibacter millerae TaxID=230361 RepID=A0A8T3VRM3_9EURY|nr:tetrahydromethanopterin S-methyltransferase subunit F [Methanobrevibacter sp.]MBE6510605.1 tetrahydromethanopterin S-methyltransferase subunit F [Methanobrevibacter millerae]MBO5151487.1 tetrahydromethanopterin S-methyltransferase subunit F [Methanobrevibacter sp.]
MVQISNKPNIHGIKKASEDVEYSSKLIAREGKLFAGLLATRVKGIAFGMCLAILLVVIIPFIAMFCGL